MDGLGNINWWGFSPSIDFQSITDQLSSTAHEDDELNILVAGAGDARHVLKTLANKHKHNVGKKQRRIRFYVYDCRLELYARSFLLLSLALENPSRRGLQEKTELFMEIFGNLNVRDQTAQFLRGIANDCIKCVTDVEHLKRVNLTCFDFSLLKFKERDFLEGIFKYWRQDYMNSSLFPTKTCWDLRLRTYFKTRYDSRSNAYDWDFAMKITERENASIINNRLYASWRDTGNAFELRDANYNCPNLTLASTTVFDDPNSLDKAVRRGYFGDTVIGPFICFGIESENKEMFKKANDSYRYTAVDVTKTNVTEMMESVLTQKGFKVDSVIVAETFNELTIQEVNEDEVDIDASSSTEKQQEIGDGKPYLDISDDVEIVYLPLTAFDQELQKKARFEKHFDLVYFSNYAFKFFNMPLMKKILKENVDTAIVFETAKYMIELDTEKINTFSQHLIQTANENKLRCFKGESYRVDKREEEDEKKKVQVETNDYFKFIYVNKTE